MALAVCEAKNRATEEGFLLQVRDGLDQDIEFVKRGGIPMNWHGFSRGEILNRLRWYRNNVHRALEHLRFGGSLDDLVGIVWGFKQT